MTISTRASIACGGGFLAVWLANLIERTVLRPDACSVSRMRYESILLLASAGTMLLPVVGLLLAAIAWQRSKSLDRTAIMLNMAAMMCIVACHLRWLPI